MDTIGLRLIAAERGRQKKEEGWDTAHDVFSNCRGELAKAAACYAASAAGVDSLFESSVLELWPWDHKWDKRKKHNRVKKLVIAGALIVAELDRLSRTEDEE